MISSEARPISTLCDDASASAAGLRKLRNGVIDAGGKLQLRAAATALEQLVQAVGSIRHSGEQLQDGSSALQQEVTDLKLRSVRRESDLAQLRRELASCREQNAALQQAEREAKKQLESLQGQSKRSLARATVSSKLAMVLAALSPSIQSRWRLSASVYRWKVAQMRHLGPVPGRRLSVEALASPSSLRSPLRSPVVSPVSALASRALYAKKRAMLAKFERRIDKFLVISNHRRMRRCVQRFHRSWTQANLDRSLSCARLASALRAARWSKLSTDVFCAKRFDFSPLVQRWAHRAFVSTTKRQVARTLRWCWTFRVVGRCLKALGGWVRNKNRNKSQTAAARRLMNWHCLNSTAQLMECAALTQWQTQTMMHQMQAEHLSHLMDKELAQLDSEEAQAVSQEQIRDLAVASMAQWARRRSCNLCLVCVGQWRLGWRRGEELKVIEEHIQLCTLLDCTRKEHGARLAAYSVREQGARHIRSVLLCWRAHCTVGGAVSVVQKGSRRDLQQMVVSKLKVLLAGVEKMECAAALSDWKWIMWVDQTNCVATLKKKAQLTRCKAQRAAGRTLSWMMHLKTQREVRDAVCALRSFGRVCAAEASEMSTLETSMLHQKSAEVLTRMKIKALQASLRVGLLIGCGAPEVCQAVSDWQNKMAVAHMEAAQDLFRAVSQKLLESLIRLLHLSVACWTNRTFALAVSSWQQKIRLCAKQRRHKMAALLCRSSLSLVHVHRFGSAPRRHVGVWRQNRIKCILLSQQQQARGGLLSRIRRRLEQQLLLGAFLSLQQHYKQYSMEVVAVMARNAQIRTELALENMTEMSEGTALLKHGTLLNFISRAAAVAARSTLVVVRHLVSHWMSMMILSRHTLESSVRHGRNMLRQLRHRFHQDCLDSTSRACLVVWAHEMHKSRRTAMEHQHDIATSTTTKLMLLRLCRHASQMCTFEVQDLIRKKLVLWHSNLAIATIQEDGLLAAGATLLRIKRQRMSALVHNWCRHSVRDRMRRIKEAATAATLRATIIRISSRHITSSIGQWRRNQQHCHNHLLGHQTKIHLAKQDQLSSQLNEVTAKLLETKKEIADNAENYNQDALRNTMHKREVLADLKRLTTQRDRLQVYLEEVQVNFLGDRLQREMDLGSTLEQLKTGAEVVSTGSVDVADEVKALRNRNDSLLCAALQNHEQRKRKDKLNLLKTMQSILQYRIEQWKNKRLATCIATWQTNTALLNKIPAELTPKDLHVQLTAAEAELSKQVSVRHVVAYQMGIVKATRVIRGLDAQVALSTWDRKRLSHHRTEVSTKYELVTSKWKASELNLTKTELQRTKLLQVESDLESTIAQRKEELQAIQEERDTLRTDLTQLQKSAKELEIEKETTEKKCADLDSALGQHEEELQAIREERDTLRTDLTQLQKSAKELEIEKEASQQREEEFQTELKAKEAFAKSLGDRYNQLHKRFDGVASDLAEAEMQAVNYSRSFQRKNDEITTLEKALKGYKTWHLQSCSSHRADELNEAVKGAMEGVEVASQGELKQVLIGVLMDLELEFASQELDQAVDMAGFGCGPWSVEMCASFLKLKFAGGTSS